MRIIGPKSGDFSHNSHNLHPCLFRSFALFWKASLGETKLCIFLWQVDIYENEPNFFEFGIQAMKIANEIPITRTRIHMILRSSVYLSCWKFRWH